MGHGIGNGNQTVTPDQDMGKGTDAVYKDMTWWDRRLKSTAEEQGKKRGRTLKSRAKEQGKTRERALKNRTKEPGKTRGRTLNNRTKEQGKAREGH